ncbi:hypothetical protein RSW36_25130 [Escherichia coli]|nr:hypothetical protein [Escherichia coli]
MGRYDLDPEWNARLDTGVPSGSMYARLSDDCPVNVQLAAWYTPPW